MKRYIVGVLIGLLLAGAVVLAQGSEWQGQQWEYLTVEFSLVTGDGVTGDWLLTVNGERASVENTTFVALMNGLGNEGWEYVADIGDELLFKRPNP